MRFMIIVKATKDSEAGVLPSQELIGQMAAYHEKMAQAGILLDGSGLQASAKGWRIKYSGTERTVIDGPFGEVKELVAGYTLIQVNSKEEALKWSMGYPNPAIDAGKAEIEVRQLFEMEDFGPGEGVDRIRKLNIG